MERFERPAQILLLSAAIFFTHFYQLSVPPFLVFDETRLVTSAYEMSKTGNILIPTIDYSPDMLSLKPPLMIALQALCIKIFGLNEFSARLPAALAALFTTLLVFYFILKITENGWIALLGGIVLSTASGYFGEHGTRWGEYNALLTLFTTAYIFAFWMFVESEGERKNRYLLLFFVVLTLAFLSKGIAALIFCPVLFAYLVWRCQLVSIFKNRSFYIGTGFFIVIISSYLLVREYFNPGFLRQLNEYEMAGRMFSTIKGHTGPPDYYIYGLRFARFGSWFPLLLFSLLLFPFVKDKKVFRVYVYCIACFVFYLAIISVSKTKIPAYDIPLYPVLAVIISLGLLMVVKGVNYFLPGLRKNYIALILVAIVSVKPLMYSFSQILAVNPIMKKDSLYDISYFLRESESDNVKTATYFSDGYDWQWSLYVKQLNELRVNIKHKRLYSTYQFEPGEKVIAHQSSTKYFIETNYEFQVLENHGAVRVYQITATKELPVYFFLIRDANRELVL